MNIRARLGIALWLLLMFAEVAIAAAAQTLHTFHAFDGSDGSHPVGQMVQGSDGAIYGVTEFSGAFDYGTVFRITLNGQLTTLHNFTGGQDGGWPFGGLVQGADGDFYGTTEVGGRFGQGCGS